MEKNRKEVDESISEEKYSAGKKNKRKHKRAAVILSVILVLLIVAGVFAALQAKELSGEAKVLKSDLKTVIACIAANDPDGAESAADTLDADTAELKATLENPLWTVVSKLPVVGKELTSAKTLVGSVEDASGTVVRPAIALVREYPLSKDEVNSETVIRYLMFLTEITPSLKSISEDLQTVELNLADPDGSVSDYIGLFVTGVNLLDKAESSLLSPLLEQLNTVPVELGSTSEKINTLAAYLQFLLDRLPEIRELTDSLETMDLGEYASNDKVTLVRRLLPELVSLAEDYRESLLEPAVLLMNTSPVELDSASDKLETLTNYLPFLLENLPQIRELTDSLLALDLGEYNSNEKLALARELLPELLTLAETYSDSLLKPALTQLETVPITNLKAGEEQFNVNVIRSYLNFAEEYMPQVRAMVNDASQIDFSAVDGEGKIAHYLETAEELLDLYDSCGKYIDLAEALLGDGSDRTYLLVAQNSAEVRASGGFPGSMGTVTIKDGILSIGKFRSVYDVLDENANLKKSAVEKTLFYGFYQITPWDACYNPHFPRVAEIWANAYIGDELDGIISLTPPIIQKVLAVTGDEITLSDGSVLNGENATKFLQYDVYVTYEKDYPYQDSLVDELFAETAKLTMESITENLSIDSIKGLVQIVDDCIDDRTLLVWFADENEEQTAIDAGCSGALTTDEENPVAGIYFSNCLGCKLGWWIDFDVECGEGRKNADGSESYDITVTIKNLLQPGEYSYYGAYIARGGVPDIYIQLFAPAGGTISDIVTNGYSTYHKTYEGLDAVVVPAVHLTAQDYVTVSYTVTTSTNAKTALTLDMTPTLAEYREEVLPETES